MMCVLGDKYFNVFNRQSAIVVLDFFVDFPLELAPGEKTASSGMRTKRIKRRTITSVVYNKNTQSDRFSSRSSAC